MEGTFDPVSSAIMFCLIFVFLLSQRFIHREIHRDAPEQLHSSAFHATTIYFPSAVRNGAQAHETDLGFFPQTSCDFFIVLNGEHRQKSLGSAAFFDSFCPALAQTLRNNAILSRAFLPLDFEPPNTR